MLVSLCVIALNEEKNIKNVFTSIINQTYNHKNIEILLIDGNSSDKTKTLMQNFKDENINNFFDIKILTNYKKVQPAGLNIGIKNCSGDVFIRVDAHSIIKENFIEENVKCIESGESVCGGKLNKISDGNDILFIADTSFFGGSIAGYRNGSKKKYIDTVCNACYKKSVFDKVGLFNEKLIRSEDNEMNYRVRKNGYKIRYSDKIESDYFTRTNLKGMLKQKFGNGKFVGLTSKIDVKIFSLFHYVPFLFVVFTLLFLILAIVGAVKTNILYAVPFFTLAICYIIVDLMLSALSCVQNKKGKYFIPLLFLYPLLHFAYGLGTLIGFIEMPFFKVN